ncbi:hypothetical protein LTR75_018344, partial [Friedmanniomyces endolithicus]
DLGTQGHAIPDLDGFVLRASDKTGLIELEARHSVAMGVGDNLDLGACGKYPKDQLSACAAGDDGVFMIARVKLQTED